MGIIRKPRRRIVEQQPAEPTDYELFSQQFPDFISQLQLLRKEWRSRLERLTHKTRTSQHHEVRKLIRSRHLFPLFAYEAIKRSRGLRNASPDTIDELAVQFDPFHPVENEGFATNNVGSSQVKERLVHNFGRRRRMHQYAVSNILHYLHPPPENQKLFNGGMPIALEAIEAAYSNGATHGCEVDFIDFYGSVSQDGLAELMRPLASSLTQHVIWDNTLRSQRVSFGPSVSSRSSPTPERPKGLSLGSATSPIVGEIIIAHLLAAAQIDDVVTYADNLFFFGRSEEEIEARIQRLRDCISLDEFGLSGLSFRTGEIRTLERGPPTLNGKESEFATKALSSIEFAKHEGTRLRDSWEWSPSPQKLAEFQISTHDKVTVPQIKKAIAKVSNWRRSYPNWPDGDKHEARHIAELKARLYLKERSALHLTEAATAICDAVYHWEGEITVNDLYPDFDAALDAKVCQRLAIYDSAKLRRRKAIR